MEADNQNLYYLSKRPQILDQSNYESDKENTDDEEDNNEKEFGKLTKRRRKRAKTKENNITFVL